ncbi:MAG: VCBS repeat-containing protein, partial [Acidobacteria bacterium]|nr:VCBS repeat-containing protein [Acidobacteriota bacterium]
MNRVANVTTLLVLVLASGVLLAQKGGGKPAPSPVPLVLADGLNIVTREILEANRIRAWHSSPDSPSYTVGWQEYDKNVPYLAIGDVDGEVLTDGRKDNELIMPVAFSVGTHKQPRYSVCVWGYKQGQVGPYYTTPCTDAESVSETTVFSSQVSVTPYDLNNDGMDEVVLGTPTHVAIYQLIDGSFDKITEADIGALGVTLASRAFARHSLAVGDVDADGRAEIVCGGVTYDANPAGDEHSYLLVYSADLQLKGYNHLTASPDLPSFVIEYGDGLQIGDTTG